MIVSGSRSRSHVQTIRLAKGTQPIPREPQVVVEKIVEVVQVIEPRVLQVLVMPEVPTPAARPPVSAARARRITDAYKDVEEPPRKIDVIA